MADIRLLSGLCGERGILRLGGSWCTLGPMMKTAHIRLRRGLWVMLGLVMMAVLLWAIWPRLERSYVLRAAQSDAATLELVTQVLRGGLERAEALPSLLAERPILAQMLRDPKGSGLRPFVNEQLRLSALSLDVADIYVMDLNGDTVAASNYRSGRSFIGRNFAFRPYFTDALSQGKGRFYALGTTSGERGYYFAAPILDGIRILGVIAVKITLERYEEAWRESRSHVVVYDNSNVVFLSDRTDWHFRAIGPMTEPRIEYIAKTKQYPSGAISTLPLERFELGDQVALVRIGEGEAYVDYTFQEQLIASAAWRVAILTPIAEAKAQALQTLIGIVLAMLVMVMSAAVLWQRRVRLLERLRIEAEQRDLLEARVLERTAALDQVNAQLRTEVEERRATEKRLRTTQTELVQAGKLAALGQMSAALSHEFNQPLGAVKSYAENALVFLERGQADTAKENVVRISRMADRMAGISKHLRNFARRPQDKVMPVSLRGAYEDALELLQPRLDKANAQIQEDWPDPQIQVMGGRLRLQQVIVSLMSNALDAMEDHAAPRLEVSLHMGDELCLRVRDHGAGLSPEALTQAFDPFFTTKAPGSGLGLGLSIASNIVHDFGGRLRAENHPEGGAVFSLCLRPAMDGTPPKEPS